MPLRIAITGSTGLVGNELVKHFQGRGCQVTRMVREGHAKRAAGSITAWNISKNTIDRSALEGHDVVIHLAGANIAGHRWTPAYKKEILNSRLYGTELLSRALSELKNPPSVFFSASAIGYYGNNDFGTPKDEGSAVADDFLGNVCRQWEDATEPAERAGIRVVHMRLGVVLSPKGGALKKMLPVFKLGLGGKLGSGKQPMSWIALSEIPRIIEFLIDHDVLHGPVNFVSPGAATNEEFTQELGKALRRPVMLPVPPAGVHFLFGEMGETLLLNGTHAAPKKLLDAGYLFQFPELKSALTGSF